MIFLKLFESKMREIQTTANSLNLKKREILAQHFQVNPQYLTKCGLI